MSFAQRFLKKIGKIMEGPQVRERVVVRHVVRAERPALKPGFIIGVYRSGTTLLRYVLDSHSHVAVPPETNFLHGLEELWRNEWYRKGLQGVGVDEEALFQRLRETAGDIFDSYAIAKGKSRWFDKTPSYIDALDFIGPLFGPECRYIMLYRHGFDVAESLVNMHGRDVNRGPGRKYAAEHPDSPRLTNARYWADQCENMLAFEAAHPERCFRIFYEQYASEPERYLPPLFEFLGEPWDPEVLRFADKQHDFGLQDSKILDSKGFSPNIGAHRSWSAQEIRLACGLIGPTMEKLGYEI